MGEKLTILFVTFIPLSSILAVAGMIYAVLAAISSIFILVPGYDLWADTPFQAMIWTLGFTIAYKLATKVMDFRSKRGGDSRDWSVQIFKAATYFFTLAPLVYLWVSGIALLFLTEFFYLFWGTILFSIAAFIYNFLRPLVKQNKK